MPAKASKPKEKMMTQETNIMNLVETVRTMGIDETSLTKDLGDYKVYITKNDPRFRVRI